ncbi:MAG: phage tail sheath C-terminal domain-containing protein, partial [Bacteroidota bacterium]
NNYQKISPQSFRTSLGTQHLSYGAVYTPFLKTTIAYAYNEKQVEVDQSTGFKKAKPVSLAELKKSNPTAYQKIKSHLAKQYMVLPPSSSVAGIYCQVDRDRGVWKAPANVSVYGVSGLVSSISQQAQAGLNTDPVSGKSINTIRTFSGKGTLVWGSRTLAGNDNEWRYVPVRRLFLTVEESIQKGTNWAVFEPNNANTWNNVKAIVEAYLTNLWRQGALVGTTPDKAFYVKVGLGETMTANEVSNGIMNVEIGMAVVRPAEFITLTITQQLSPP